MILIIKVVTTMLIFFGVMLLAAFLVGLAFVIYVIREVMRDDEE